MKLCKDCKYFEENEKYLAPENKIALGYCNFFDGIVDLISGETKRIHCLDVRYSHGKFDCGREGRHFVERT